MIIYVDVSAKIEQWNRDSAVGVSNGDHWTLLVPTKVKRYARQLLGERYHSSDLKYRMLALLIYCALQEKIRPIEQIVIDLDCSGTMAQSKIKMYLLNFIREERPNVKARFVRFENVKGSKVDVHAREVFQRKRQPSRVLDMGEVERTLRK